MTTVAIFLRHQFIIQQLRSQGALTYNEIYDNYKDRFGDTFELRTLQRDIKDIECIYKIKIKYSKSDKVYRIVEEGDASVEDLLEAFDVFQAFQEHEDSYRYVVFDPRQLSGTQHLSFLIKAIIQQKRIEFRYQKRYPPICLKSLSAGGIYWEWMSKRNNGGFLLLTVWKTSRKKDMEHILGKRQSKHKHSLMIVSVHG